MSVAADLEEFILSELLRGSAVDAIALDEDLLAAGIVDSHGLMELVTFLKVHYGVVVRDDQLTPENFQTLQSIDAFVQRERG
jgi:acyl carrier protein